VATSRQKIQVGVFLAASAALLVVVLLYVAGVRRRVLEPYYAEFEENMAGISEGSEVTYRGVSVGKVLDLVVTPENRVGVTLGIDPVKVTVRQGVRARYSIQSIFGPYVIDLSGGPVNGLRLEPGSTIPVKPSLLTGLEETVAETVPLALQRAANLMTTIDKALASVKPEDVAAAVRHADAVLVNTNKAVDDFRTRLDQVAAELDKAVRLTQTEVQQTSLKTAASLDKIQESTEAVAGRASRLLDTLQATVDENRPPLSDSLRRLDQALAQANEQLKTLDLPAAADSLRRGGDKVGKAADEIGAAATAISQARGDLGRSVASIERDLSRTLEQLDRTLRSARDLLDYLERHPSALLRGKPEQP